MNESTYVCSILLREGSVDRRKLPALTDTTIRKEVEKHLKKVGLELATSAYSEHYGLRLIPDVTGDEAFDSASNMGLHSDACALLVILWIRLVLPKRMGIDSLKVPGQSVIDTSGRLKRARDYSPFIHKEAIIQEFGDVLGVKSHIQSLLSKLARLNFIRRSGGLIGAGPLLELAIDGERMMGFIRDRIIIKLVERAKGLPETDQKESLEQKVLDALVSLEGETGIRDLEGKMNVNRTEILPILKDLIQDDRVEQVGKKRFTLYRIRTQKDENSEEK